MTDLRRRLWPAVRAVARDGPGYSFILLALIAGFALVSNGDRPFSGPPAPVYLTRFGDSPWRMEFRPAGDLLAVGGLTAGTVELWDLSRPRRPVRVSTLTGHQRGVAMAFSPDGRTLAAAGAKDPAATLWDVSDPARPVRGATFSAHAAGISDLAYSPDGRTVATASADKTVMLWDVSQPANPARLATLTGHTESVSDVAFSPDGRTLATGSGDRTAVLWDVSQRAAPARRATLSDHTGPVFDVTFSPDGRTLATGGQNPDVVLWDVSGTGTPGRLSALDKRHDGVPLGAVGSVAFSPDGRSLVTASVLDDPLTVWDITNRTRPVSTADVGNLATEVQLSPDGRTLVNGSFAGVVVRDVPRARSGWDVRNRLHPVPELKNGDVGYVAWMAGAGLVLLLLALLGGRLCLRWPMRVGNALAGVLYVAYAAALLYVLDIATISDSYVIAEIFPLWFVIWSWRAWRRNRPDAIVD